MGRSKASYFRTLGFDQTNWQALEREIRALPQVEMAPPEVTEHGQKFIVRGSITGPNGRTAIITADWIVLSGEDMPRFVTAYPGD